MLISTGALSCAQELFKFLVSSLCWFSGALGIVTNMPGTYMHAQQELKYASESAKVPSNTIQIALVDTPRQEKFSEAFGVTANDIPCAVIFNARKLKFARMLGSFTGKNIENFISDTLAGKVLLLLLLPPLSDPVQTKYVCMCFIHFCCSRPQRRFRPRPWIAFQR